MTQSHGNSTTRGHLQPFQVAHHMQQKLLALILAAGAPEHIEVNFPLLRDTSSLGQWTGWSCGVRNEAVTLESFISRTELFALFRHEFGPTGAALDHPAIQLASDGDLLSVNFGAANREHTGGNLFVSTADSPYVMPLGDANASAWSAIRFRLVSSTGDALSVDSDAVTADNDWALEVEVNPFHGHVANEKRNLITKAQLVSQPVIRLALGTYSKPMFLPVAKVIGVSTHVAMLQLAADVVGFRPDN